MKLKTRYKSFVSSLKKVILKLKEKVVLCAKQSKPVTQIDNEFIDISVKEAQVYPTISLDCIGLVSIINGNIQKKKNTVVKRLRSTATIDKATKIESLISTFNSPSKYNIQTHSIYHKKRLFV